MARLCPILALMASAVGGCGPSPAPVWRSTSEGIRPRSDVVLVSLAPHDPQTLYMSLYEPDGLYRRREGGSSWEWLGEQLGGATVLALAVSPRDPEQLYVGSYRGALRSLDGGQTWASMPQLPAVPVYAMAFAPNGGVLYAGTEAEGVWASGDGGASWSSEGLTGLAVVAMAVGQGGCVYAGTAGQGLWRLGEGGQWQAAPAPLDEGYVSQVSVVESGAAWALA